MKATARMYHVIYQGEMKPETKIAEEPFAELSDQEKKKLGQQLTDKFMKRAGFSPAPG